MYIDRIQIQNFRTFRDVEIDFVHPDQSFRKLGLKKPALPNVNLLLGNNGSGKTALLKAVALAALGPAVRSSGIFPYYLVRREPRGTPPTPNTLYRGHEHGPGLYELPQSTVRADFTSHEQDRADGFPKIESEVSIFQRDDLEEFEWSHPDPKPWHPIYSKSSDAFFFVGYGATRHVEQRERVDPGSRNASSFTRAQRVRSLFEEDYSLIPLSIWLPPLRATNPGRFTQVVHLINRVTGPHHYQFTGKMNGEELVFERHGQEVPFRALSDGYRAFLGWVGDLLYHVVRTCPNGKKLVDNRGIVMVDEIDLHLHPKWQLSVLPVLAQALPNLQFIFTSHSPLLVGSLEWMNLIVMCPEPREASRPRRINTPVHGLDADQVLLTEFFGMESTRAPSKRRDIKSLALKAREGDSDAALALLRVMSHGSEGHGTAGRVTGRKRRVNGARERGNK